ncbi:AMP-binding protein [Mycobacterium sp. Y57]|uniref:AMP-binding protein n=1 Tax=Mycolicibacterium xanthum TaxID=2796469 RepID=UPI001C862866|nr:AMP-binding protein [Mycolicibacterium xanthum]MBX7430506.1 AMP-binding protein [Mycolicibacterium xanthum]
MSTELLCQLSDEARNDARIVHFMNFLGVESYDELVRRSSAEIEWFNSELLRYIDLRFYRPFDRVVDLSRGKEFARWCIGGVSNLVLNCIDKHRGTPVWGHTCLLWEGEDGSTRTYTYAELDAEICRLAGALRSLGYGRGDVIGLYLPMIPETFVAFFAIVKIGAIAMPLYSGFGAEALATRLTEGGAKAVVTANATLRRGEPSVMKPILDEAVGSTPSVRHVVVVRRLDSVDTPMRNGRDLWWHELIDAQPSTAETERMPADSPAVLLFTSGTSGVPKGAIYTQVGFVAKQALDMTICADFRPDDRWMWMSDMGWMVGAMTAVVPTYSGASFVIAEGTPDFPTPDRFWRLAEDYRVSYLGMAPTLVRSLMRRGVLDVQDREFADLRMIFSGGEPWTATPWNWLFDNVCRRRVPILTGSGGTECGGSLVIGTPIHPMRPGAIGGPAPGMGTDVVDAAGNSLGPNEVGELVMRSPSIGLTAGLWNDPDGERYLASYWQKIPSMWVHGDWAMHDDAGLWYVLGRSDDTINVAGKRTGPSEIENVLLETGEVSEAAAVGMPDSVKGTAIACVCIPMPGKDADSCLVERLGDAVAHGMGSSYRPKAVLLVDDLPRTRNQKIMRRVVRSAFTGEDPGDLSALVNPDAIEKVRTAFRALAGGDR